MRISALTLTFTLDPNPNPSQATKHLAHGGARDGAARYRGDTGEMQGRYRGDTGEIQGLGRLDPDHQLVLRLLTEEALVSVRA